MLLDDIYKLRLAESKDIQHLLNLNKVWQIEKLSEFEKLHGYLSVGYDSNDFEVFISNKEVVVISFKNEIVGYYLLNNYRYTKKREEGLNVIKEMKTLGIIKENVRVGIGAQVVVSREHQGKGLSRKLLEGLCNAVNQKYDLLYSSLSKNNSKGYTVHTNEGWEILFESDNSFYVFLYLNK